MTLTLMIGSDASQRLRTTSLRLIACSIRRGQTARTYRSSTTWRPTTSTKRVKFTREIYEKYEVRNKNRSTSNSFLQYNPQISIRDTASASSDFMHAVPKDRPKSKKAPVGPSTCESARCGDYKSPALQ